MMTVADIERRLTLAFAMAIYVHITKDNLLLTFSGVVACFAYPWVMQWIYSRQQ